MMFVLVSVSNTKQVKYLRKTSCWRYGPQRALIIFVCICDCNIFVFVFVFTLVFIFLKETQEQVLPLCSTTCPDHFDVCICVFDCIVFVFVFVFALVFIFLKETQGAGAAAMFHNVL